MLRFLNIQTTTTRTFSAPGSPNSLSIRTVYSALLTSIFCLSQPAFSAALEETELAIINEIESAQSMLNTTERSVSEQRSELATRLNRSENEIRELRQETSAARRLADESTLRLEQLQQRLEEWDDQSRFQKNLLGRFKQQATDLPWTADTPMAEKLEWLQHYIRERQSTLLPEWENAELVMEDGTLTQSSLLTLGPVTWFWQAEAELGGFAANENNRITATLVPSADYQEQIQRLYMEGVGEVVFDPTLSRALRLEQEQENIIQHIEKGGIWAIPILAFAAFALSISLLKTVQIWRLPPIQSFLSERLISLDRLTDKAEKSRQQASLITKAKGMQKQLLEIVQKTPPGQVRDDRLFSHLLESKHRLDYWLGAIAITASVSPLLGLLGTVSGMIEAFRLMTLFGAGDPAAVSSGISEALVTTELGLIVAIPSLVLHALLSRWVKSYYGQLETSAITLSQVQLSPIEDTTPPPVNGGQGRPVPA